MVLHKANSQSSILPHQLAFKSSTPVAYCYGPNGPKGLHSNNKPNKHTTAGLDRYFKLQVLLFGSFQHGFKVKISQGEA